MSDLPAAHKVSKIVNGVSFEILDRQYHTHMQNLIELTTP